MQKMVLSILGGDWLRQWRQRKLTMSVKSVPRLCGTNRGSSAEPKTTPIITTRERIPYSFANTSKGVVLRRTRKKEKT